MKNLRKRIRTYFASEKEKIRYLDTKGKLSYVLRYYWLWILGIGGGLFMLCYILFHVFFAIKEYAFYGIFANTSVSADMESELRHDFVEYAGYDTKQKKVEMNTTSYFDPSVKGGTNNSYYQMFVTVTEAKELDVLVMGTEGLRGIGSSGRLLDLAAEEKTADLLEKYRDRLIFCEPYDETYIAEQISERTTEQTTEQTSKQLVDPAMDRKEIYQGGQVPVAIDLSDSLLVTKYHLYEEGEQIALGLGAYTQRPESAKTFLAFILPEG